ncbi:hypothetical protein ACWOBE_06325 [Hutsoniella sourekii]
MSQPDPKAVQNFLDQLLAKEGQVVKEQATSKPHSQSQEADKK